VNIIHINKVYQSQESDEKSLRQSRDLFRKQPKDYFVNNISGEVLCIIKAAREQRERRLRTNNHSTCFRFELIIMRLMILRMLLYNLIEVGVILDSKIVSLLSLSLSNVE